MYVLYIYIIHTFITWKQYIYIYYIYIQCVYVCMFQLLSGPALPSLGTQSPACCLAAVSLGGKRNGVRSWGYFVDHHLVGLWWFNGDLMVISWWFHGIIIGYMMGYPLVGGWATPLNMKVCQFGECNSQLNGKWKKCSKPPKVTVWKNMLS